MFVELFFSLPMFVAILVGGFEVLRLSYNYVAVQIISNRAVEWIRVSPCPSNCNTINTAITNRIQGFAQGLGVADGTLQVCFSPQGPGDCLSPNGNSQQVGSSRQLFTVRVRRQVRLVFGLGSFWVDAIGIGRHEPLT